MKRLFTKGLAFFLILFVLVGLIPMDIEAANKYLSINKSVYVMKKGSRYQLRATIIKDKYKGKKIVWSSSKKSKVKVSSKGSVLAKKKGSATITAKIKGTKKKITCKIYVGTPVSAIQLSSNTGELEVGKTKTLKPQVFPSSATIKTIKYSSSNAAVAKVSSTGKITAVKEGWAVISLTSKDGHDIKAKYTVHVLPKPVTVSNVILPDQEEIDQKIQEILENKEGYNLDQQYLELIKMLTVFIQKNGASFYKDGSNDIRTYAEAKSRLLAGKKVAVNCTTPMNWALHLMGLRPEGTIYGSTTGFHISSSKTKSILLNKATWIKTGNPIGMTFPKAVEAGYLKAGDMISFKIKSGSSYVNHSAVYAGLGEKNHPIVYEAGGLAESAGYAKIGCGPLDYCAKSNYYITGVIRFNVPEQPDPENPGTDQPDNPSPENPENPNQENPEQGTTNP